MRSYWRDEYKKKLPYLNIFMWPRFQPDPWFSDEQELSKRRTF
jgi:hypothetical protein